MASVKHWLYQPAGGDSTQDSIQEFKVQTSNLGAGLGQVSAA